MDTLWIKSESESASESETKIKRTVSIREVNDNGIVFVNQPLTSPREISLPHLRD